MLKLLTRLLVIVLVALVLFLFLGSQFFQNAGSALINAINGSAVHGQAQVVPSNAGKTSDIQVSLQGLPPKQNYDVTLDQNQCGGPVVQDIGTVTTDASGNVTKTFTVSDISKVAKQSLWVDIHQGPNKLSRSTACGQVELNSTSASQVSPLGSTNSSTSSSTDSSNVPSGVSNSGGSSSSAGNQNPTDPGLPDSGVAPGGSNSYDNYTFPRKY